MAAIVRQRDVLRHRYLTDIPPPGYQGRAEIDIVFHVPHGSIGSAI